MTCSPPYPVGKLAAMPLAELEREFGHQCDAQDDRFDEDAIARCDLVEAEIARRKAVGVAT